MRRRTLLWGSAAITGAGLAGAALWKPGDLGGPHNQYFAGMNEILKSQGPGRPVMVLDLDRANSNIDTLTAGFESPRTYRIVVKSLPSVPLLQHIMQRAGTRALMVFHQPFLNVIAEKIWDSDVLMGKPMPVAAVRTFYANLRNPRFNAAAQVQWLIDSEERLEQYLALAKNLGIKMRVNFELDVGLHRGGFASAEASGKALATTLANPAHLEFAGFMGYEPHLAGVADTYDHPAMRKVLQIYAAQIDQIKQHGLDPAALTINGAGSHTIRLYEKDRLLNDLSAGSGIVKPSDFDTAHLSKQQAAFYIATPVLKHYDKLTIPGDPAFARILPLWNPNTAQVYFIYGGYWKAGVVSPPGIQDWMYHSTNQQPMMASRSVNLKVDDYMFLRPTQSEHVMLQFGDLVVLKDGELTDQWPVFQQTG